MLLCTSLWGNLWRSIRQRCYIIEKAVIRTNITNIKNANPKIKLGLTVIFTFFILRLPVLLI
jgi:hypothetical protein